MTAVQPTATVNENISTFLLTEKKNVSGIFSTSIYNIWGGYLLFYSPTVSTASLTPGTSRLPNTPSAFLK